MTSHTVVATANVNRALGSHDARRALHQVLEHEPDLVGLQEWHPWRFRLLAATGSVGLLRGPRFGHEHRGYLWTMPFLGDCVVGARSDRFSLVESDCLWLSRPGRADAALARRRRIEPPHLATVATYDDRSRDRRVTLIGYHLVPGVQSHGVYREDRPLLAQRHRDEVSRLQRLVDERLALGHTVYALGDSNFDGLRLSGLTSAWEGRDDDPGTLGPRRKIDDVHGPSVPLSVQLLTNASDHKAVVVDRAD
ncbi:exonuclease/endonuclease/phosphatase family protein [Nocardioides jensenii]|uniref:endonuclease/exonuclease/phosphatase family protein n=1 Tax=Nocardioides jensenii TaxID=1843 RepID=UPI000833A550|nr:endonuclease/exonuclease/phosphatase family protein [Nocardioides jensenii]